MCMLAHRFMNRPSAMSEHMTADETLDPQCEVLADHFLGGLLIDPPNPDSCITDYAALRWSLAQRIQQAVEAWFEINDAKVKLFQASHHE